MSQDLIGDWRCLSYYQKGTEVDRYWYETGQDNEGLQLRKYERKITFKNTLKRAAGGSRSSKSYQHYRGIIESKDILICQKPIYKRASDE